MAEKTGTIFQINRDDQWKIFLFGGIKIIKNGKPVSSPPYRTCNLLAFLLLRERLPINRERLGGYLYRDLQESKVRRRISDYTWLIKKNLQGFPIISTPETIDLKEQSIWLDVKVFQDEVNKPESALTEASLNLYRGELLPELYDEWVLVERERWRSHYLRMLRAVIRNMIQVKRFETAISYAKRLLSEEPFDEAMVRLLMQTYIELGRRGAALALYEKYHLLSSDQLGLEPDEKTKQIYAGIKSQITTPRNILLEKTENSSGPEAILKQAKTVLEQGKRDEFYRLLAMLPDALSPDHILEKKLLEIDEKLIWRELDQVENLLARIKFDTPLKQLREAKFALAQQDYQKTRDLTESILRDVKSWKNIELEAEALIVLSLVNAELGNAQDVLLTLDRVLSIIEEVHSPTIRVQALLNKGTLRNLQGFGEGARDILFQAAKIARKNNLKPLLAEVLHAMGKNSYYYGKYQNALRYLSESLEIARDLNLSLLEATALLTLSGVLDFLGRHSETIKAIQNATEIYERLQAPIGMAKCYYNLSLYIPNVDEESIAEAIEYADKALQIFIAYNSLGWQASTHTALGYLRWLDGQAGQAVENFDFAIELHTQLEEHRFIPENYAYKGLAYNSMGDSQRGFEFTNLAIQMLTRRSLNNISSEIYFAHASVLLSLGQEPEAKSYIERGYDVLQEGAKDVENEDARVAYFERDPIVRRLMQLAYDYEIAPKPMTTVITHKLPGSGNYQVELALTVDAGAADQALKSAKGNTALRRIRLKRILKEGNIHGSQLSIKEIAQLLDVSTRTIQRDLKHIKLQ